MLAHGNTLKDMHLPPSTLVIMVKRGERYLVPNGRLALRKGDHLLLMSQKQGDAESHSETGNETADTAPPTCSAEKPMQDRKP